MDYQTALDYVWGLVNFETKPPDRRAPYTLDRMRTLLAGLDNPQNRVPAVHITGSKGKGSTAAMVESVLRAAGYRTGLYTSPHLHSPRERIRIAGTPISREEFVAFLQYVRPVAEELHEVTTFEFLTAMAFCYFVEQHVDVAVVEVGLGGTLDATNLIERPLVAIITPISLDHTEVLGDTVSRIAEDKAGIIKPGVPVVSARQTRAAADVLQRVANRHDVPFTRVEQRWSLERTSLSLDGQIFSLNAVSSQTESYGGLFLPLLGRHQMANAATAVTALQVLRDRGVEWDEDALRRGLADVSWPARIEVLAREPFVVTDGAHNGASAQVLRDTLDELVTAGAVTWETLWLVLGMSRNKALEEIVAPLLPLAAGWIVTQADHPRAAPSTELAQQLREVIGDRKSLTITTAPTVADAVRTAQERVGPAGAVIVTGSLFVAAEAREVMAPVEIRD